MSRGEREPFNPLKVSPSRLNSFVSCGVAFKMSYIDRLPPQRSGSAALFGSVLHQAQETWAPDRRSSLIQHTRDAWADYCKGTVIGDFLAEYAVLSADALWKEKEIRDAWLEKGKVSKAPRMTAEWKKSEIGQKIASIWARWHDRLDKESFYRFSEYDPLPALYDESLVIAGRYQQRFGNLAAPLFTEMELDAEFRGFTINAYIDTVEPVYGPDGEIIALCILDYKSYRLVPAPLKDYRQVVMYDAGLRSLVERGAVDLPTDVPWYVGVDYLRWTDSWVNEDGTPHPPRRFWTVSEADYDRLERELQMYRSAVEAGVFLPAEKGRKADFCDYPDNCCLRNCGAAGGGLTEVIL